jgi:hypothetical protein
MSSPTFPHPHINNTTEEYINFSVPEGSDGLSQRLAEVTADIIVIEAPPRTGKDHSVIEDLLIRGNQWNGITISHHIVEHQLGLIRKICKERNLLEPTVIHLEGKKRCCRNHAAYPDCRRCSLFPQKPRHKNKYIKEIESLLSEKRIVAKEDVGQEFCPFYALLLGLEQADIILTVKELFPILPSKDRVLFIDEEETINYFRAKSVRLLEITKKDGLARHKSIPLSDCLRAIQELKHKIEIKERQDIVDRTILACIEKLEEIHTCITEAASKTGLADPFREELAKLLQGIQVPTVDYKEETIKRLRAYAVNERVREAAKFIEPLISFAGFHWQTRQGSNKIRLYLIADESEFYYLNKLQAYDSVIIVGRKEAGEFAEHIGEYERIRIESFKWADNFLVFFVENPMDVIRANLENDMPQLVLCGSKERAFKLYEWVGRRRVVALKGDTMEDIRDYWGIDNTVIFYNNSSISKGVDLPVFDVFVVYDYNFSEPYYEACRGEDDLKERILYETIQSVLRITPTPDDDVLQPKIVVLPKRLISEDLPFIGEQRQETRDPEQIARMAFALCRRNT